jgi:hypothetical protein
MLPRIHGDIHAFKTVPECASNPIKKRIFGFRDRAPNLLTGIFCNQTEEGKSISETTRVITTSIMAIARMRRS